MLPETTKAIRIDSSPTNEFRLRKVCFQSEAEAGIKSDFMLLSELSLLLKSTSSKVLPQSRDANTLKTSSEGSLMLSMLLCWKDRSKNKLAVTASEKSKTGLTNQE